ncbi:hypothetical protein EsDP_00002944 [Epichloe bromicola]|uniref:Chromo domain-containing protein n=1 Tax=Epichloe bromicola TaxID=79588 RepID=A0ABQ0CMA2_9HYPO
MPPALSDEENSDREIQPSAARSSRSSRSAADDAVVQDEPVAAAAAATPDVAGSNGSEDEDNEGEDMEEDEFIVESIKNHMIDEDVSVPPGAIGRREHHRADMIMQGTLKFQVKWEGYDSKKDLTWEPEENLEETAHIILDEYFEAIGGREKIFEQTEKAARADSTPPASAPKQWAPPAGSWEEEIATIDACEEESSGRLVVFLIWKNGMKTKHDTACIYKKCPQKMLQFYERHVKIIRDDAKSV